MTLANDPSELGELDDRALSCVYIVWSLCLTHPKPSLSFERWIIKSYGSQTMHQKQGYGCELEWVPAFQQEASEYPTSMSLSR